MTPDDELPFDPFPESEQPAAEEPPKRRRGRPRGWKAKTIQEASVGAAPRRQRAECGADVTLRYHAPMIYLWIVAAVIFGLLGAWEAGLLWGLLIAASFVSVFYLARIAKLLEYLTDDLQKTNNSAGERSED